MIGPWVPPKLSMRKHWKVPRRVPVVESAPSEHNEAYIVSSLSQSL
jgi:hypothetical protein